jgi:small-conductance mechanosensitive channel
MLTANPLQEDAMSSIVDQFTRVLPFLPAVVVVLLAMVASRLSRRLLTGRPGASGRGEFRLQIAHLIIGLTATVLVLVVLPAGPELRGQLLSLFGIMLSAAIAFASTTFVGNVMAGMMLKAVRNFRTGDFVRVGDQFGRVTERGLLSTEIQTEDRDLVTLPNLFLVTNPVKVVRASGTVITAEVSLGYDIPHTRIEPLLEAAATDAGLADAFVLITNLGDFSVTYRVAGLLEEVKQLLTVRSRLHACMLDHLHQGGVEIVSPNFMNQRVLSPEARIIPQTVVKQTTTSPQVEAKAEKVAFDKAEEAESLEQLERAHTKTREAIAALADPPEGSEPEAVKQQQEQLTRRLARLEAAIAAKAEKVDQEDEADH